MPAQTWPNPATITRPRRQTPVYQSHRFRGRHDTAHSGADRAFWAPAARVCSANSPGFNPHPPLRADAISVPHSATPEVSKFQSSPALTGGCYSRASTPPACPYRFNPHPPLRADARQPHLRLDRCRIVSILTRPYGRMLLEVDVAVVGGVKFQSSPALTGGCSPVHDFTLTHGGVSILTRPYGRMLRSSWCQCCQDRCFNPHPPLRADAPPAHPHIQTTGGRCFNPHPPLRADARFLWRVAVDVVGVSILTRPYGRMLASAARRRCGGRCFNPHPPLRADAPEPRRDFSGQEYVSILTRPYGRMLQCD